MSTLTSSPLIAYINRASGKTITVSSENATYPGSNLNAQILSTTWRSATGVLTSVTVSVDLTSSLDIDIIALLGFNGNDSATRQAVTSDTSNFSVIEGDSGSGDAFDVTYSAILSDAKRYGRHLISLLGQTYNSRYARLTLSNSGLSDNYLKGSILWVGPAWQFPQGLDIVSERRVEFVGTPGVETYIISWRVIVTNLTESQARQLASIVRNKLRSGRYVFVPHPGDSRTFIHEVIYCTCVGVSERMIPAWDTTTNSQIWEVEVEFREVED